MDKIFLHGMKAETLIGVYEWERQQPQTLLIDLDIGLPPRDGSDDIADTVHYAEVCAAVRESLRSQDFFLLETLAEHIATLVLDSFCAAWVKVRLVKPGILSGVRETGVEIERAKAV
ncbi:Dihydroneopterin aldolase [Kingella potus]|uniref:Dihydroneopterin aldolase n=1 Tax=Kingella potus TaxID=265175 RepID=A0A377R3T0_9NEIS|nr:dihydroneopterin aldolase [Kingella potus]UOP00306.1 dihydroneopterin aldolase [Kingella potus]STR02632.1 Dihydroneopterin aldolase [Kingella potus]